MQITRFLIGAGLGVGMLGFSFAQGQGKDKGKAVVEPDAKVLYKEVGDVKLHLHVFKPEGMKEGEKRPGIVFFFGGGWNGGTPSQFYPHAEYLAKRGMVAISAEYRVKSRNKTTPKECVMDGKSAIRWVRANAGKLGIDADKLAAGGGSAGGHVAAATALTTKFEEASDDKKVSCMPGALVLFNPVYDNGPENGYGYDRVKEYWKDISPRHNISEKAPPTIVFLGSKDRLIPVSVAEGYKKEMEAKGRRCDLHVYEGQTHGFFNKNKSPEHFKLTVKEMDKFLVSLGYLEKK